MNIVDNHLIQTVVGGKGVGRSLCVTLAAWEFAAAGFQDNVSLVLLGLPAIPFLRQSVKGVTLY